MHHCEAFFVTKAKDNMTDRRLYSHPVEKSKGVIYGQTLMLNNYYAQKDFPEKIRHIKFIEQERGKTSILLTNNFTLPATDRKTQ